MKKIHAAVLIALLALAAPLCGGDLASLLAPIAEVRPETSSADKKTENAKPAEPARPEAILVAREDILAALAQALAARYPSEGKLSIDTPQQFTCVRVKDANWRVEIVRASGNAIQPRMSVAFRVICGSDIQWDTQMIVTCALYREVLVANRRIDRGETVGKSDFDIQAHDVLDAAAGAGTPVPASQDISDYAAKSAVGQGQMLYWRDIELKPTVRRGQVVEAVADEGYMHVAVKAMVLQDGRKGDIVSVRNLSSNKEIQARIVNERTVQVYF
jgi:flagella basal body P-ring formation protein FlgA